MAVNKGESYYKFEEESEDSTPDFILYHSRAGASKIMK
jgi:hypothetical protein